ncbi:MAG TPA: BBP7 family outer membrane beta-barrel protein [Pirellulales bacterium]|nr:BBP7 family outer membrane beta-barrel protein [Pirellulales bacterium]
MKSSFITLVVSCLLFPAATSALADVDYFAPTIDPNSFAPAALNGPLMVAKINADFAASTAAGDNPHDLGTELVDNQVQTCAAQSDAPNPSVQPPVPPPAITDQQTRPAPATLPASPGCAQANSTCAQSNLSCAQTNPTCSQTCAACSSSGSGNGCNNCCGCQPWWVHVDYLALWIQGNHLPPLVTTSPDGTGRSEAGVLPGATILYGNNYVDIGARNGGRVTLGFWFDDENINGLEASWLTVGQPTGAANFFANSSGSPILARPFTSDGVPNSQLAAYPTVVIGQPHTPGTLGVTSTSSMDFAEIAFSHVFERDNGAQLGWIAGYRHLEFRENLSILENIISIDPANVNFVPGTALNVVDQFQTDNDFEGAQLGTQFSWNRNRWTLDGSTRLGFGNVHEKVNINGMTTITDPSGDVTQGPGLLAQPSNDGTYSRNVFAFLPELELNLRYRLTDQIDLSVGYTFLLITRVARVGDQIDTNVSSTDLPTANPTTGIGAGPTEVLRDTSMWAQGISGGIELRF